jgi:DNA recombination protein RmuC
MLIAAFVVGAILGGLAVWLVLRERLTAQRRASSDLSATFKALSAEALQQSTVSFLDLAADKLEGVATVQLSPIKESLQRFDRKVEELERARQLERGALSQQIQNLQQGAEQLRGETAGLVTALRASEVRGQWGELQLRRTLEAAGMLEHCDFDRERSTIADDGVLRPDVIVRLPGGKNIVVDAKVPGLEALIEAFQTDDEGARSRCLDDFVRHVRDRMRKLGEKAYWRQFAPAPEYVIMFLPSESFYRYAIERDGSLLELGPKQKVIFASPMTLIMLLKTAAAAWREETVAESAREISEQGRLLYERLATMGGHFSNLGGRLGKAVEAFNETLGSLETRVLPTARRFPELGISSKAELAQVQPIDLAVRSATASELTDEEPPALGRAAGAAQ